MPKRGTAVPKKFVLLRIGTAVPLSGTAVLLAGTAVPLSSTALPTLGSCEAFGAF